MPKNQDIPNHSKEESDAGLMSGYDSDVSFDTSDAINDGIGFGRNEKYSPQYPESSLSIEDVNSRASAPRRKS